MFTTTPDASLELCSCEASGAYDPVHDLYFVFAGGVRFVNRSGVTIARLAPLGTAPSSAIRVAYSPDLSDGRGGRGGFLVVWAVPSVGVFAQIVSFPMGPVGPATQLLADAGQINHLGLAYSPIHQVFLLGIGQLSADTSDFNQAARILRVDLNAQPIDGAALSTSPSDACLNVEFPDTCNRVDVAWNPVSEEFGVVYSQGKQKVIARVSGNGALLSRTPLAIGAFYGAFAVNRATGTHVVIGAEMNGNSGSGSSLATEDAEVSPGGAIIAQRVVTSSLDTEMTLGSFMDVSYAAESGSFLLSGRDVDNPAQSRFLELDQHGSPTGSVFTIPSEFSVMVAHATAAEWLVAANGAMLIIRSATRSFCATPDPFVVLGGGTCFSGGWLPPGIAPPPLPVCAGPDPFAALGGGGCVNGGWVPPANPVVTPTPPSGCLTPDPFVALGGGHCLNGGWVPPDNPGAAPVPLLPPTPPPPPGACLTPDPFTALGGGSCVSGGWFPPGVALPPPPACTTPDPFVAIGGGVCVNGGWRPRG